jgi:peptidoglycan/xylan/chitin deacetylase (PgdA/CDA1 family)
MARALQAPPAGGSAGPFDDPWTDESRRDRAGPPTSAPFDWQGWRVRLYQRELVRLLDRSPVDAQPTPGHLGDLFVTLDEESRARGADGPTPVQRPTADPPSQVHAPILTYHLAPRPEPFQAQLEGLLDTGLTPVSFEHLVAAVEGWTDLPENAFVISFDDGWLDQLDGALPVLQSLRVPAVFFVLPGFDRHGQGHMTLADIQAARAAGVTVGSHTINHADLPPLVKTNLGAAQAEVVESRLWLEADVDGVDYFAYPLGRFDPDVQALVAAAGYRAAVTTVPGIVHNLDRRFALRRVGVETWWPLADVTQKIRQAAQADGVSSPV